MKPYLKDLLIIALILLCFLIGCHWNKRDVRNDSTTQTVYVKGKETIRVDTVEVKVVVYKPTPIVTYAVDTIIDSSLCDSIREYELSNDTIKIASTVQGKLIKQDVLYKMFNTSTNRVDTVFITEPSQFKPILALGATLQFDSIGYIKPALGMLYVRKKASWSGSVNTSGRITVGGYFNLAR
jgi:hypothetical protein